MTTLVSNWVYSHRWAVTPEYLETIISVANRENVRDAVVSTNGEKLTGTRTVANRDGVAVIPVIGVIFPRAGLFTEMSGGAAISTLATDFQAALENPNIDSIVLNIDSPGGEVTGVSEFSNMIYSARGVKPVTAYVMGMGCSAAYWIASAADRVVVDATAEVGSIGVIAAYQDAREKDAKSGVKTHEIVSSVSPNKRPDPATPEGRGQIQAIVDDLGALFVGAVARNRGTTAEVVASEFGKGGVFVGASAVKQGLADEVGSLEQVISDMQTQSKNHLHGRFGMDLEKLKAEHPEVYQAAFEAGKASASVKENEWIEAGATAERERIAGIETLSAVGCEDIIAAGKADPKMSKEMVAFMILDKQKKVQEAAVAAVEADAKKTAEAAQGSGSGNAPESGAADAAVVQAIANAANEVTSRK
jgi:capsid assembly protease